MLFNPKDYDLKSALTIGYAIRDIVAEDCRLCNEDYKVLRSMYHQLGEAAINGEIEKTSYIRMQIHSVVHFLYEANHLSLEQSNSLHLLMYSIEEIAFEDDTEENP